MKLNTSVTSHCVCAGIAKPKVAATVIADVCVGSVKWQAELLRIVRVVGRDMKHQVFTVATGSAVRVRDAWAGIASIADAIAIDVDLVRICCFNAIVADITDAVTIHVELVRIKYVRAVVITVGDTIGIGVGKTRCCTFITVETGITIRTIHRPGYVCVSTRLAGLAEGRSRHIGESTLRTVQADYCSSNWREPASRAFHTFRSAFLVLDTPCSTRDTELRTLITVVGSCRAWETLNAIRAIETGRAGLAARDHRFAIDDGGHGKITRVALAIIGSLGQRDSIGIQLLSICIGSHTKLNA
jgi:hypothetical protein